MKIFEVKSENFKRLSVVDITFDGKGVIITGKNGVGKSTFIDAIYTTLTGKDVPPDPVQTGKDKAKNTVKIKDDDGNIIIVEKTFAGSKKTLTVKTATGAKYSSPQNFLNETIGNISFDPFEFINKSPMEQKQFLMDLLKIDFTDIEKRKRELLADNNNITKGIESLRHDLNDMHYYKELDGQQEKEASALLQKIQEANAIASSKQQAAAQINESIAEQNRLENQLNEVNNKIEELISLQEKLINDLEKNSNILSERKKAIDLIIVPDVSAINNEIKTMDEYNSKIRSNNAYIEKQESLEINRDLLESNQTTLKALEAEKIKIIKDAKMPVLGLAFDDSGLLYNGLQLTESQISKAKLIEIGLKISMALNPNLRIMRIKDGSLLDSETLEIVRNSCKENDYQLFLEKVTDDNQIGFILEEN